MPSCSKPCVCGRGHRTGGVRGVSSHWANLVPLPKAREAFFLLLFTSLTLKAPYSYIPFLPTLSSRNSVFWRDELQPCICEVNELQNTSKEKERSTPLHCSSLWAPHSCEGAGVHQAPPAHGPVTQLWLGVAPVGMWELHLLTPVLLLLGGSLGARLLWLVSMQQVGDSGAALAAVADLSKGSLLSQPCCVGLSLPCCPCGFVIALWQHH